MGFDGQHAPIGYCWLCKKPHGDLRYAFINQPYTVSDKDVALLLGLGKRGKFSAEDSIKVANALQTLLPTATKMQAFPDPCCVGSYVRFSAVITTKVGAEVVFRDVSVETWEKYKSVLELIRFAQTK